MLEWPATLQMIVQCGSLGVLAVFLLRVFPRIHADAVDKISEAYANAGAASSKATADALKDAASAIRETNQRLDRLAGHAVCRYPTNQRRGGYNEPSGGPQTSST